MPYVSEKQRRWLHEHKPEIAKQWDLEERASRRRRRVRGKTILTGADTYGLPE